MFSTSLADTLILTEGIGMVHVAIATAFLSGVLLAYIVRIRL